MHRIAENLVPLAVPIGSLIPYPGNARVHADATLAESLQVNEQYRPLVVQRSTSRILAGNGTWKAALALGWTEVAATFIDCDDATARRIVLVDNRASDLATYDDEALRAILSEVVDLPGTGYAEAEVRRLVDQLEGMAAAPVPAAARPMGPSVDIGGSVVITSDDARNLSLDTDTVDLIVTSPPYWALRSYQDSGQHYEGQIGSEETPQEWLSVMLDCTREWVRVLKPTGSLWVNLGDKYSGGASNGPKSDAFAGFKPKSLLGLPWRYAIACTDQLGLTLRAEVIWSKTNGLPESVTDRVRRSHEQWFHFVLQPKYYAAVDEIREEASERSRSTGAFENRGNNRVSAGVNMGFGLDGIRPRSYNPLGKLPGSVWEIPTQPLRLPDGLSDHFAAFPIELPRRIILGWSPPGICTVCGEGRQPVATPTGEMGRHPGGQNRESKPTYDGLSDRAMVVRAITGYVCACTPYVDHPGSGERHQNTTAGGKQGDRPPNSGGIGGLPRVGPRREYQFDDWTPPETTPAVVLDPFGGTGTTALVASVLGRTGITNDLSKDYCDIARWRTADANERAKVLRRMGDHDGEPLRVPGRPGADTVGSEAEARQPESHPDAEH